VRSGFGCVRIALSKSIDWFASYQNATSSVSLRAVFSRSRASRKHAWWRPASICFRNCAERALLPFVLVTLTGSLVSCIGGDLAPPDVAASMKARAIRYQEFEDWLMLSLGEGSGAMPSEVLSGLFDQFLEEALLRRWAQEDGLTGGDRDPLAVLLDSLEPAEPSAAEVEAFYADHKETFLEPDRVRLRQILVGEESVARQALAEISAGVDFRSVAGRVSREPAALAGDEGVVARDDVPPAFEAIIFSLDEGEVSGVVPADSGFHVFQAVEILPARLATLQQATPRIRRELARQAADRELDELVARAADRYNVEVHEPNLPFNYSGRYGRQAAPQ
jgi:hypothetical protein